MISNRHDQLLAQKTTLLFDLDGTLINSRSLVVSSVFETVRTFCPGSYSYEELDRMFGHSYSDLLATLDPKREQELIKYCIQWQKEHLEQLVTPFQFVKEGLQDMKASGLTLAVVTNQHRELTLKSLGVFELEDYFSRVITIDDVAEGKPSPQPILYALERLAADAPHALMIGDSSYDILAANRAKVDSVLLDHYGASTEENAVKATSIYADFQQFALALLEAQKKGA